MKGIKRGTDLRIKSVYDHAGCDSEEEVCNQQEGLWLDLRFPPLYFEVSVFMNHRIWLEL